MPTHLSDQNRKALNERTFWHPHIERKLLNELHPSKRNARTHSEKQLGKLIAIIGRFGFINPIAIDENNNIIAGHLQFLAAGRLGMTEVPVIQITHFSESEKRVFALAENRIGLDAGWDREILSAELGELAVLLPEEGIELTTTAFEIAETELIINDAQPHSARQTGEKSLDKANSSISRVGDVWILGRHRLYCGEDVACAAAYVDDAVRRWQRLFRNAAILEATGETFAAVSTARSQPSPKRHVRNARGGGV